MRIIITGATGFVGINTVKKLKEKHEIHVFVRKEWLAKRYFGNDVKIKIGDIRNIDSVREAFDKKFDAVVHIAGVISAHDINKLYMVNRLGCRNIARVAKENGVSNFIYVSSLAARGPDGVGHPVSHYGNSKRLGELEIISTLNNNIKIVRPPIIFGPHDKGTFPIFKLAKKGIFPILNRTYSFLFIDDLVDILSLLLEYHAKKLEVVYASSFTKRYRDIISCLSEVSNKKGIKIEIPLELLRFASLFSSKKSPLSEDKMREILPKAWTCDNETVRTLISYEPKTDMCRAIRETYKWYIENGWI